MAIQQKLIISLCVATIGMAEPQPLWADNTISKPNVLFIAIDDLRPELGCYGAKQIITPSIDKLAADGTVFMNSYCNVAVCGASRASLLTGMRPIPGKRFKGWNSRADLEAPGIVTLPEYFKQHGYYTISNGKVMHVQDDSPQAWDEPAWRSNANRGAGHHWYNIYHDWLNPASESLADKSNPKKAKGPFWEAADVPDNAYHDGQISDKAINDLKRLAKQEKPFFLACGFWRPHLPFNAPKKYWDLYDRKEIAIADNRFRPKNAPKALRSSGELKNAYTVHQGFPENEDFHRLARHGYFASVSYIDAQVGKIIQSLVELGLYENTIVVVWGDHGFHLGEHNFWGKHNTMDRSVRAPLIIRHPGNKKQHLEHIVEFVDIYPSLCDLASLPVPKHCEGKIMKPIMNDPSEIHKEAVFPSMGSAYAVKTKNFLYTEWGMNSQRMFFDHSRDPQENVNVAELAEYQEEVERHHKLLMKIQKIWQTK